MKKLWQCVLRVARVLCVFILIFHSLRLLWSAKLIKLEGSARRTTDEHGPVAACYCCFKKINKFPLSTNPVGNRSTHRYSRCSKETFFGNIKSTFTLWLCKLHDNYHTLSCLPSALICSISGTLNCFVVGASEGETSSFTMTKWKRDPKYHRLFSSLG